MKTGSRHKCCGRFVILLAATRYVAGALLILLAVLTCYTAVGDARRGSTRDTRSDSPQEVDRDPEYLEKRSEFLSRFFGMGPNGISPNDYATAAVAARGLPSSPLLHGR